MDHPTHTLVAATAAATFVAVGVRLATTPPRRLAWQAPAALAVGFAAWSGYAVVADGPVGFWRDHTSTPWGTQIWLDLLLSAGLAWFLLQPRLRTHGISPLPWFALVLCTGSIGLLAAVTRLALAERQGVKSPRAERNRPSTSTSTATSS